MSRVGWSSARDGEGLERLARDLLRSLCLGRLELDGGAMESRGAAGVSSGMLVNRLLAATAVVYALAGVALTFAPAEIVAAADLPHPPGIVWIAQALGAALLALGWLNWLHRFARTAGILGRTVVLPNVLFAMTCALHGLAALRHGGDSSWLLPVAIGFGIVAVAFASRLFVATPADPGTAGSRPA